MDPKHSTDPSGGRPPSVKISVQDNQVAPGDVPPFDTGAGDSGAGFSCAYIKTMAGWMRVINLVVVIIATLAAYNTYPLQHFPMTGSRELLHSYSYVEDVEFANSGLSGGSLTSLKSGKPGYVYIDPFANSFASRGYPNEFEYMTVMYEPFRTYYSICTFVAVFIIAFLLVMLINPQIASRKLKRWLYIGFVGVLLIIAAANGAIAATALSCCMKVPASEDCIYAVSQCGGKLTASMPIHWIAYFCSIVITVIGAALGFVIGFLCP